MALIEGFNDTIVAISIVLTVLLAIVNIMQIVMSSKGVNPLTADGVPKYAFFIIMLALIVLLIAHIVTAMGNDGVGKDDTLLLVGGVLALIFAVVTAGCFLMKDKLVAKMGDNSQYVYYASLVILWICIIIHIYARASGKF